MNTRINKAYFLIPIVYIAVIGFLLYMQFSGSRSFQAEVSGISMNGRTHAGAPGKDDEITELSVHCNGINFSFGKNNPLLVFSQDGLTHKTVPQDYRVTASGIDIRLTKGISVSFYYSPNDNEIIHISITAEDPESIKYIHLPVAEKETELSSMEGVPVLSAESETLGSFFLTLPESGTFNADNNVIVIYPEETETNELTFEKASVSGLDAFTYWVSGNADLITPEQLSLKITAYIENANEKLMNARYNQTRGTWATGTGLSAFSEKALIMAATESIGTASYARTMELLNQAAASHSRELTGYSSALFGNIVNTIWSYDEELDDKPAELLRKTDSFDYSVFEEDKLTAAVLTEDSAKLIDSLVKMSEEINGHDLTLGQAAAMLAFYSELSLKQPELALRFDNLENIIELSILPSLKVLSDRLFIANSNNTSQVYLSLKTGMLLMNMPGKDSENKYQSIGGELVNSVLQLSNDEGYLPETVSLSDTGDLLTEGIITPETVYPLLSGSPYAPAEDYFYAETGEKICVLNQAETFTVEKNETGYRIAFDFPAGLTHTFAVRNIPPFYQMNMLGYRWNSDHRFQNYSSGWWYDRQHNTLFVKIRHREKTEELVIRTERPPEPAAPPVSETETPETSSGNEAGTDAAEANG